MSTQPTPERARVDPGGVRSGVVLVVALATGAVMALGVALAWELQAGARAATAQAARFGAPPAEKDGIEMSLFARHMQRAPERARHEPSGEPLAPERALVAGTSPRGAPGRAANGAEQRLHSYGWADRAGGRVHIPIGRAMELLVEREAREGATP